MIAMSELKEGQRAVIVELKTEEEMTERFLALGMRKGTEIHCLFFAFSGDPIAFEICGCTIALRKKDIKNIIVHRIEDKTYHYKVVLAGNPNVGKSTLFNYMTGLNQHTGNWIGKTVESARGICKKDGEVYEIYDLPGTYSLCSRSEEEKVAEEYLRNETYDCVVVVCDASCLKRNLILCFEMLCMTTSVIVCVNLLDEAKKNGILIDLNKLQQLLQVPVKGCTARTGDGVEELLLSCKEMKRDHGIEERTHQAIDVVKKAEEVANQVVTYTKENWKERERKIDTILTSKKTGIPIMLCFLFLIFWITLKGANIPSQMLSAGFEQLYLYLNEIATIVSLPKWLDELLFEGIYKVTTFVISVMLPPMAIFFSVVYYIRRLWIFTAHCIQS